MPIEGEDPRSTRVEYEPVSVKDVLVEMKDTSELLIDLAYSAVLHRSDAIAEEVLRLEERMDVLELRARMSVMMAARNPEDTEMLAPVLGVVGGAEKISDAAGDVAKIVLEDMGLPEAMRAALPEAFEPLERATVAAESDVAGRTLGEIDLESETGVRVIGIRRGDTWLLNPGPDSELAADDVALIRGPEHAIGDVYERLSGASYQPVVDPEPAIDDLDRAVDSIVHMKNLSELAVDVAYGSVLFDDVALAEEVRNLEVEVDALQSRFEAWTLGAAAEAEDPVALRGLIRLGIATETISDAALEISEGVLREIDVHPVVELAVQESDEVLTRIEVEPGSELEGADLQEGVPTVGPGTTVIAIRRPEVGWMLVGQSVEAVAAGDVLITKGTRTAADELRAVAAGQ
ncbi:potassium channel family protein [Salinarchaeum chitinilyticum]